MCQKAGLRGLVVVGCGEKAGVGPELLCGHRELYGLSGAVGPGTRDDGHLPPGVLYRKLYDLFVFLVGKCRGLTRRSAGHDAVDTPATWNSMSFFNAFSRERRRERRDKRRRYLSIPWLLLSQKCFLAQFTRCRRTSRHLRDRPRRQCISSAPRRLSCAD